MCSAIDRFLGYCGYMPPSTRFAVYAVIIAALLAISMRARG
jgi:hypothetical protein